MEFSKMNILVIFVMASLVASIANTTIVHTESSIVLEGVSGESIIIEEGDVLLVSAYDPIIQIGLVHIGTGTKSALVGCNLTNCTNDLSSYQTGDYTVNVTTSQGGFSGVVTVSH